MFALGWKNWVLAAPRMKKPDLPLFHIEAMQLTIVLLIALGQIPQQTGVLFHLNLYYTYSGKEINLLQETPFVLLWLSEELHALHEQG